ncbi:MAG: hypothetical protein H8Z69_02180 [Nanohaloarchaea archaeon]|nr:hypothetical protein [Candidatus Nanohaloarchaea archaeon]
MPEEIINLSKALINGKEESRKSIPYAKIGKERNKEIYNILDPEEHNITSQTMQRCKEKQTWSMDILSELINEKTMSQEIEYITSSRNSSKLDPPRKNSDLKTEKFAYFAGVAAGDGGFNGPNIWSVVDGGKPEELEDSRKFIEKL